ncbi:hypothetical protein LLG96_11320 [bacterium]|nr:hypothetical protein [bacterium]
MSTHSPVSHRGFFTSSGVFILLNAAGMAFELGFNGVVARLPGDGFGIFETLFNVFFIITVPLVSIQLMVSKEVSALMATGKKGQARSFVKRSFMYIGAIGIAIMAVGLAASGFIARIIHIGSTVPVILLMIIIGCYIPFPVLLGTIQGLKKFYIFGLLALIWGILRFSAGVTGLYVLGKGLNGIMTALIGAVALIVCLAYVWSRDVFGIPEQELDRSDFSRAYGFVLPIAVTLFCVTVLRSIDMVFANRFYAGDTAVNAYACAAKVGKAFFTLTGIIMIMFPYVSEEKSLNRNPFVYLARSLVVTVGLSSVGILVSLISPDFVIKIIMVGKYIPGAENLVRAVGIVIMPVSIIYITANYFLAQHRAGFIPILLSGMVFQIVLILLYHDTPFHLLAAVGIANYIILLIMGIFLLREQRRLTTVSAGDS